MAEPFSGTLHSYPAGRRGADHFHRDSWFRALGQRAVSAGIVIVAALPLFTGILLLLRFINHDTQQIPRDTISPRLPSRRKSSL
jgi:hypothetical protein